MVEATPIQIQIDPETLREQVRSIIEKEFEDFAFRLRQAADDLDGGVFLKLWEASNEDAYKRGFEAGRAEGTGHTTNHEIRRD